MKKNIPILVFIVLLVCGFVVYTKYNETVSNVCALNKSESDSYVNRVLSESMNYKVRENELDRQATDGSFRKIFTDKNDDIVLIEDKHSGESGFRTVSVILKDKHVVKIIDELTHYDIPPIEDSNSKPIVTKDEFYVISNNICAWYKQDKLVDQSTPEEKEYLNVIQKIILDANDVAKRGISN